MEAAGDRRQGQGIYDYNVGVGRGKISTKTTIMKTEASEEYIQRVQGIGDNDGGGSGSKMGPVYWQRQWSVYFTLLSRC